MIAHTNGKKENNMKYYLVFTPDRGSREDCSVYYSNLVIAENEDEAKEKFKKFILESRKKYLIKNGKTITSSDEQKILDQITFTTGDYDDDGNYELLEVNPIQ